MYQLGSGTFTVNSFLDFCQLFFSILESFFCKEMFYVERVTTTFLECNKELFQVSKVVIVISPPKFMSPVTGGCLGFYYQA